MYGIPGILEGFNTHYRIVQSEDRRHVLKLFLASLHNLPEGPHLLDDFVVGILVVQALDEFTVELLWVLLCVGPGDGEGFLVRRWEGVRGHCVEVGSQIRTKDKMPRRLYPWYEPL